MTDIEGLREHIAKYLFENKHKFPTGKFYSGWEDERDASPWMASKYRALADQILSFITPLLEKAREEEREKLFEWGNETCPHDRFSEGTHCYKHACDDCWHTLRDKER